MESPCHGKDCFDHFGKFVAGHHGTKLQEISSNLIKGNYERNGIRLCIQIEVNLPVNF